MIPGLPNPWLLLGATFAVLAMIVGSYLRGDAVGSARVQVAWDVQHATEQRDAIATGLVAEKRAHEAETAGNAHIAELEKQHDADAEKVADIERKYTAARGGRGLRDAGGKCTSANSMPNTAGTALIAPEAATGCELSKSVSDDLSALIHDADVERNAANDGRGYGPLITEFRATYGQNTAPPPQ